MAVGSGLLCLLDRQSTSVRTGRIHGLWLLLMGLAVSLVATALESWHWRLLPIHNDWQTWQGLLRLLLWFTWPTWPLALWTLWQWRRQWTSLSWSRHLVLPLWFTSLIVCTALLTHSTSQTLLLALPVLATLAAFALPTMRRSMAALIDWFTLLFFSACALAVWVVWIAMQTGWPAQPAANVKRQFPEFEPSFGWIALIVAAAATLAWIWLVIWRTSKNRHALWKSMVLPAGGAALCWLLLLTLWLPMLNYALSYQPWVQKIQEVMQKQDDRVIPNACLLTHGLSVGQMTAFGYHGNLDVKTVTSTSAEQQRTCQWLLVDNDLRPELPSLVQLKDWTRVRTIRRPADKKENVTLYYQRQP
jgi:hypothetical protein